MKKQIILSDMKRRGFSVAEAMITLLIVSLALAAMAPIMSKKTESVKSSETASIIPKGALMFFDVDTVEKENALNPCPIGWEVVSKKYNGRYFKVSGDYSICDKSGEDSNGDCINQSYNDGNNGVFTPKKNQWNSPGQIYGDRIRNLWGKYSSYEFGGYSNSNYTALGVFRVTGESWYGGNAGSSDRSPVLELNASRYVPIGDENMPRSIAMLTCRKK